VVGAPAAQAARHPRGRAGERPQLPPDRHSKRPSARPPVPSHQAAHNRFKVGQQLLPLRVLQLAILLVPARVAGQRRKVWRGRGGRGAAAAAWASPAGQQPGARVGLPAKAGALQAQQRRGDKL
jgi:hypothetical protein